MNKAWDYPKEQLEAVLKDYKYQPELTIELNAIQGDFEPNDILKIVLWKVNRYAQLDTNTLRLLNELTGLNQGEHRNGETALNALLAKEAKGIDLPMASTILRFRNPKVFQIIDRRAYRVLMSADKYTVYNSTSPAKKAELYFEYLDELLRFCAEKNIAFIKADQILYQLDKHINDSVGLDGKPKKQRRQPREGWEE